MLVSVIGRSIPYNLWRVTACIISRNKIGIKVTQYCNESNILSTSLPHLTAGRIYSTGRNSQPQDGLSALVEDAFMDVPSFMTPLKLFYLSTFKIIPYIDKEFDAVKVLEGARYASIVISKALANKNFESLQGLVADHMIEILTKKIETLSPNKRQLIELKEDNILFYILSDVAVNIAGNEHSIEITTFCVYHPGLIDKIHEISTRRFVGYDQLSDQLACNYKFTRKYINNIGGPWIATLVNHISVSNIIQSSFK